MYKSEPNFILMILKVSAISLLATAYFHVNMVDGNAIRFAIVDISAKVT